MPLYLKDTVARRTSKFTSIIYDNEIYIYDVLLRHDA